MNAHPPYSPRAVAGRWWGRAMMVLGQIAMVGAFSGCSTLDLPRLPFAHPSSYRSSVGQPLDLQNTDLARRYQCVRQAKTQNGVVLEVVGDEEPYRVLPLPEGQKSVFVSHLLAQTGVQRKLGQIKATLYRCSNDSWTGIPMEVRMADEGQRVRPESDYALRAGDRLRVEKDETSAVDLLVDMALAR